MRRIGVLMSAVQGDQRGLEYVTAFAQGLAELGWTVGRNVRIEYRWGAGDLDRFRRYAAELVGAIAEAHGRAKNLALSPRVTLSHAPSTAGIAGARAAPTQPCASIHQLGARWP